MHLKGMNCYHFSIILLFLNYPFVLGFVSVSEGFITCVQVPTVARDVRFPLGAELIGGRKLSNVGAEHQIWLQCKGGMYSSITVHLFWPTNCFY